MKSTEGEQNFQMTVADQRATQKLLNAALQTLKGFYDKKNTTFKDVTFDQQEPAGPFKYYSKNKQAGGVQDMIQSIIDNSKAMETTLEEDAANQYSANKKLNLVQKPATDETAARIERCWTDFVDVSHLAPSPRTM